MAALNDAVRHATDGFVGILDMFGFEDAAPSRLEQLCANLCAETMQHFYNTHVFKSSAESCREEVCIRDVSLGRTNRYIKVLKTFCICDFRVFAGLRSWTTWTTCRASIWYPPCVGACSTRWTRSARREGTQTRTLRGSRTHTGNQPSQLINTSGLL